MTSTRPVKAVRLRANIGAEPILEKIQAEYKTTNMLLFGNGLYIPYLAELKTGVLRGIKFGKSCEDAIEVEE